MGHMNVPWAVGGGALNDEALARMLPYFMFGGQEGILKAADCQVQALSTPGTSVRVAPGGYNINARGSGQMYEAYLGKIRTEDNPIPISSTGAGVGRSDLVIIRVEDPNISGEPWSDPGDVQVGPYVFTRVIENVPSSTNSVRQLGNNFSAITLARIDIPASTGTITQAMIKDLRSLVNPLTGSGTNPSNPPAENEEPEVVEKAFFDVRNHSVDQTIGPSVMGSFAHFPTQCDWIIPIPPWATGADVYFQLNNVEIFSQNVRGQYRVSIDNGAATTVANVYDINLAPDADYERHQLIAASTVAIPAAMRGKAKRFRPEIKVTDNYGGSVRWKTGTTAVMQIVFKQYPIFG